MNNSAHIRTVINLHESVGERRINYHLNYLWSLEIRWTGRVVSWKFKTWCYFITSSLIFDISCLWDFRLNDNKSIPIQPISWKTILIYRKVKI